MKKLLVITLTSCFFAVHANALTTQNVNELQSVQRDSIPKMREGDRFKDLHLTPAQTAQRKEQRENLKQKREAVKNDQSLSADQKQEKMRELNKSQRGMIASVLTPGQKATWQADRKNGNARNYGKRRGGYMMNGVNLSPDQKAQIKVNHDSLKQKREAIKNDQGLTEDQKKAKMRYLVKNYREKMNSILTAEQQAKIKENKKAWKEENKGKNWHAGKAGDSTPTYRKSNTK